MIKIKDVKFRGHAFLYDSNIMYQGQKCYFCESKTRFKQINMCVHCYITGKYSVTY